MKKRFETIFSGLNASYSRVGNRYHELPKNILQSASRTLRLQHQKVLTPLRENK